jgi:hypothetical protein
MTDFEQYSLLVGVVSSVATFTAVFIAIWGERIRQKWNSPQLRINLSEPSFNITTDGIKGWYYLIRVANSNKSAPAKNVRILLIKTYKKAPDGSWCEHIFSGPTQVSWRWPEWSPLYSTVGPDEWATFGSLLENSEFNIRVYWYPNNLQPAIRRNDPTRLQFKAVSDTAESNILTVEVAWDGNWVEDKSEIKKHLIIKTV